LPDNSFADSLRRPRYYGNFLCWTHHAAFAEIDPNTGINLAIYSKCVLAFSDACVSFP
jgi:hypothetical protein